MLVPHSHLWIDQLKKISKETQTLNDTMDQLDLTDIYRKFHPKTMNFTFLSNAHGTFSGIDHILDHKSSLGKFKIFEIISSRFFWSQCSKIRCQLQEEKLLKYKYMEAKQYTSK